MLSHNYYIYKVSLLYGFFNAQSGCNSWRKIFHSHYKYKVSLQYELSIKSLSSMSPLVPKKDFCSKDCPHLWKLWHPSPIISPLLMRACALIKHFLTSHPFVWLSSSNNYTLFTKRCRMVVKSLLLQLEGPSPVRFPPMWPR